jgi:hypothetical protein
LLLKLLVVAPNLRNGLELQVAAIIIVAALAWFVLWLALDTGKGALEAMTAYDILAFGLLFVFFAGPPSSIIVILGFLAYSGRAAEQMRTSTWTLSSLFAPV